MRQLVRVVLTGTFALALLALLPCAVAPAHAWLTEINLNSSNVQVIHNTGTNKDVLNLTLNVTNEGDPVAPGPTDDPCDGGDEDLLETGVHVKVYKGSCESFAILCSGAGCPILPFDFFVNPYVEHDIGSFSYGTFFAANPPGTVASRITALPTAYDTCGTWNINLQATGLNLSSITSSPIALFLNDSDNDGGGSPNSFACFDVPAQIGNGIVTPHQGLHHARH